MLYYLFNYLDSHFDFPGAGLFNYISFRAACSVILSLIISLVFGKNLIAWLKRKQVGETVRDLGLQGQMEKSGTPTMGGLIILAAIVIPTLLFAKLSNIYILTMLVATVFLGFVGFMDDYIKVFKKNKAGLAGKSKIVGQVGVGIIIASMLYYNENVFIKTKVAETQTQVNAKDEISNPEIWKDEKSLKTTIPFIKGNEFNYAWLMPTSWHSKTSLFLLFAAVVVLIVTAVSNGANITDGIDGLAAGTSAIIGVTLALLAFVSGKLFEKSF